MRRRAAARLYGLVLRLYPADFRARYGASMRRDLEEALDDGAGAVRIGFRTLRDLLWSVPAQWRRRHNLIRTGLGQDVRFALRRMRAHPRSAAAIVVTLALGLGVGTVVYGLVRTTLWRPITGAADPDRLVAVFTQRDDRLGNLSYPDYQDLVEFGSLEDASAATLTAAYVGTADGARRVTVALVTPSFLDTFGARPARGPGWDPDERGRAALLSHALFQETFGDSAATGGDIELNGTRYRVAGVMPRGFRGPWLHTRPDVWVPVAAIADFMGFGAAPVDGSGERILQYRGYMTFQVFGRTPEGTTQEQARASVAAVGALIRETFPDYPLELTATPVRWAAFDPRERSTIVGHARLLAGVGATVWAVALANVTLLLALSLLARQRELSVRAALGAGRGRLVRQLVVEGCLLGASGAALALIVIRVALPAVLRLRMPAGIQPELAIDGHLLAAALAAALASGALLGLVSGVAGSRIARGALGDTGTPTARSQSLAQLAVVVQVAASLVLLVAAALLARTLVQLGRVEPGFDPNGVVVASLDLDPLGYDEVRGRAFLRNLLDRLEGDPGVVVASVASEVPLDPQPGFRSLVVEGVEPERLRGVAQTLAGPGYAAALGVEIAGGRDLRRTDDDGSPGVVLVNESLASLAWPGRDPVGQTVASGPAGPWFRVVGVVRDHRHDSLRRPPRPRVYWSLLQVYSWAKGATRRTLLLRGSAEPSEVFEAARRAVRIQEPALSLFRVETLVARVRASTATERQAAALLGTLAALAGLLTGVGLAAMLSYWVRRRRREIGVRVALGAPVRSIRGLVIGRAALLVGAGALLGLGGAVGVAGLLRGLLFGIETFDAGGFGAGVVVLLAVGLLASYLPARRASAVDPVDALRES